MATIGTFTRSEQGFTGTIRTLAFNIKATIRAVDKDNDKAPDFRIYAGPVEFGAGWTRTSSEGREYISAKLDDPGFAAPIYGRSPRARKAATPSTSSGRVDAPHHGL